MTDAVTPTDTTTPGTAPGPGRPHPDPVVVDDSTSARLVSPCSASRNRQRRLTVIHRAGGPVRWRHGRARPRLADCASARVVKYPLRTCSPRWRMGMQESVSTTARRPGGGADPGAIRCHDALAPPALRAGARRHVRRRPGAQSLVPATMPRPRYHLTGLHGPTWCLHRAGGPPCWVRPGLHPRFHGPVWVAVDARRRVAAELDPASSRSSSVSRAWPIFRPGAGRRAARRYPSTTCFPAIPPASRRDWQTPRWGRPRRAWRSSCPLPRRRPSPPRRALVGLAPCPSAHVGRLQRDMLADYRLAVPALDHPLGRPRRRDRPRDGCSAPFGSSARPSTTTIRRLVRAHLPAPADGVLPGPPGRVCGPVWRVPYGHQTDGLRVTSMDRVPTDHEHGAR